VRECHYLCFFGMHACQKFTARSKSQMPWSNRPTKPTSWDIGDPGRAPCMIARPEGTVWIQPFLHSLTSWFSDAFARHLVFLTAE
jgi:hypothetical protein